MEISSQVEEKKRTPSGNDLLQKYGISINLAVKIYHKYGTEIYSILQENPYRLADDIQGVGFKIADEIASRVGIRTDSDFSDPKWDTVCITAGIRRGTYLSAKGRTDKADGKTVRDRAGIYRKTLYGSGDGAKDHLKRNKWNCQNICIILLSDGSKYSSNVSRTGHSL